MQCAMWPTPIVMIFILGQDSPQVRQIPNEGPIEDFPSAGADPPLHDRVRARRLDRGLDDPDADAVKHRIESGHELGIAIADEKLNGLGMPVDVHQEIARLLGRPRCGWVGGGPKNMDPPGGVPLEYWVTRPDLRLCGMVILADQARDDGFSPDAM
jgi:hypothetical protein